MILNWYLLHITVIFIFKNILKYEFLHWTMPFIWGIPKITSTQAGVTIHIRSHNKMFHFGRSSRSSWARQCSLKYTKKLGQVFTKRKRPREKGIKDQEYTIVTNGCATLVYYSRDKVRARWKKKEGLTNCHR